jgi:predicted dithiol-disulfide oxidoreductase (DUF899 family)
MIGTRVDWLQARRELLDEEKELTRRSDALAARRRELPWVAVDEEYVFDTVDGPRTLAELFDGRSQLVVYHFMHGPLTPEGCVGCTFHGDQMERAAAYLNMRDTTFVFASRSPLPVLQAYAERFGWTIPWVSSGSSSFNDDFSFIAESAGYNFTPSTRESLEVLRSVELMALSCFVQRDGVVYHTYTTMDRGTDVLNPAWQLLDRTPLGRRDELGLHKRDEVAAR